LEQLLSSGGETLTVELVHKRLGTASDERLLDLVDALADHDPAAALRQVEEAAGEGVQPTDLLNGLLEFLRDVMVLAAGGGEAVLLSATPRQAPGLQKVVDRWSLDSVLAAIQILAEARGRLRGSPHGRLLVELALVRVTRLENLGDLATLIGRLAALEAGPALKKKPEPPAPSLKGSVAPSRPDAAPSPGGNGHASPAAAGPPIPADPPLDLATVRLTWPKLIKKVGMRLGVALANAEQYLAISGPNILAFRLPAGYNGLVEECDTPEARSKIEQALHSLIGRPVSLQFDRAAREAGASLPAATATAAPSRGRDDELEGDPIVRKVVELFEARRVHTEYEDDSPRSSTS
jgi:DNA polymerase III subunit gamma/tau